MLLVWYPKCSTCQKAKAWLDGRGVGCGTRDIKLEHPGEDELLALAQGALRVLRGEEKAQEYRRPRPTEA